MKDSYNRRPMPVVLRAIPISSDLKRYYWSKYEFLKAHNGPAFAAEVFKQLRTIVMEYVDCVDRHAQIEKFLNACPVRKNGWLRRLFVYADVEPLQTIQFLKLYCSEEEPVISVEDAAHAMAAGFSEMGKADRNALLDMWLYAITHTDVVKDLIHDSYYGTPSGFPQELVTVYFNRVREARAKGLPLSAVFEYELSYLQKMRQKLTPSVPTDEQSYELIRRALPTLRSYASFRKKYNDKELPADYSAEGILLDEEFNPFEEDLNGLFALCDTYPWLNIIVDCLPEGLVELQGEVNGVVEGDDYQVGNIRHIPKKGTVKRRAIADPNKFLQAGLRPYQRFLRSMTHKIPHNCQFAQDKLDKRIYANLQHGFAGSVDLSQATDWLPFRWFSQVEKALFESWYPGDRPDGSYDSVKNAVLLGSRRIFRWMCRGPWWNEDEYIIWTRGQPLGTAPSFEVLTITHFACLEALCWFRNRLDSPYALLGDDVVLFDQGVWSDYKVLMTHYGVKLNEQKSFHGRLTEFAGKVFVKNNKYWYTSDVPMVGWSNLFDYQRSTGVWVPYRNLPKEVKSKLRALSCSQPGLRAEDLYTAMRWCAGGQADTKVRWNKRIGELVLSYYASEPTPEEREQERRSRADSPLGLYGFSYLGTAGTYDREMPLPTIRRKARWWKSKVRPETTTCIAKRCLAKHGG